MNQHQSQDRLSPGKMLQRARMNKDWSVDEVAQKLKLPSLTIKNIENDQANLNSDIYQRGYAMNYAKLLGLDSDHFNQSLGSAIITTPPPTPESLQNKPQHQRAEGLLRFATYALGTAVVAVPLVWSLTEGAANFFTNNSLTADNQTQQLNSNDVVSSTSGEGGSTAKTPSHLSASVAPLNALSGRQTMQNGSVPKQSSAVITTESSLVSSANTAERSSLELNADEPTLTVTEQPTNTEQALVTPSQEEQALTENVDTLPAQEMLGPDSTPTLKLSLQSDSWVEITDAQGERLEYDLIHAGSSKIYDGQAPFRILIGRATGAELEHLGHKVDLAPYIRGNVASFELAAQADQE